MAYYHRCFIRLVYRGEEMKFIIILIIACTIWSGYNLRESYRINQRTIELIRNMVFIDTIIPILPSDKYSALHIYADADTTILLRYTPMN